MRQAHQHAPHISSQQQQPTGGGRPSLGGGPRGRGGNNSYYPPTGGGGYAGTTAPAHATVSGAMQAMAPPFQTLVPTGQQLNMVQMTQIAANPALQALLFRGAPLGNAVGAPSLVTYPPYNASPTYSGMQNGMYQQMPNSTGLSNNNNNAFRTQGVMYATPTGFIPQQPAVSYNIPGSQQSSNSVGGQANGFASAGVGDYNSTQNNITGQVSAVPYGGTSAGAASGLSGSSMPPGASTRPGGQSNYGPTTAQFGHVSQRNSISGPSSQGMPFSVAASQFTPSFASSATGAAPSSGSLYQPPFGTNRPAQPPTPGATSTITSRPRKRLVITDPKTGKEVNLLGEPVSNEEQTTAEQTAASTAVTAEKSGEMTASSLDTATSSHAAPTEAAGTSSVRDVPAAAEGSFVTGEAVSATSKEDDGVAKHNLDLQRQFAQQVGAAAAAGDDESVIKDQHVPQHSAAKSEHPYRQLPTFTSRGAETSSNVTTFSSHQYQQLPSRPVQPAGGLWRPERHSISGETTATPTFDNTNATGATNYSSATAGTDIRAPSIDTPSSADGFAVVSSPADAEMSADKSSSFTSDFDSEHQPTPPSLLHAAGDTTPLPGREESSSPAADFSARSSPGIQMRTTSGQHPDDDGNADDEAQQQTQHRRLPVLREDSETAERVTQLNQQHDQRRPVGNNHNIILTTTSSGSKDTDTISSLERIRYKLEKLMEIGRRVSSPDGSFLPANVKFLEKGNAVDQNDRNDPFSRPSWQNRSSAKPSSVGGGSNKPQHRQQNPPMNRQYSQQQQIVINLPMAIDVELNKAEKAWKPKKADQKQVDNQAEKIFKEVRAIMNKLTPNNIEKLKVQLATLEINSEDEVEGVVNIIFDKALDEPNFCQMYAQVVHFMMVKRSAGAGEDSGTGRLIRGDLLKRLQNEFEKIKDVEQSEAGDASAFRVEGDGELTKEDLELKQTRLKKRYLGNIRFVGELYAVQMIPLRVILSCMVQLMPKPSDMRGGKCTDFGEEKLESLCKLIMSVGHRVASEGCDVNQDPLRIITRFKELVGQKATSSRLRFSMTDVVEASKSNWKNATGTQIKTIEQIHDDFYTKKETDEAQAREDMKKLRAKNPNAGRRTDGGGAPGGGSMPYNQSSSNLGGYSHQGNSTMPTALFATQQSVSGGGQGGMKKSNTVVGFDGGGGASGANRRSRQVGGPGGGGLQTFHEHSRGRTPTGGVTPTHGGSSRTGSPGGGGTTGGDDSGKQSQQTKTQKFMNILNKQTTKAPPADSPG